MIQESIVDPNAEIAKGYPPNVMPPNFGQTISARRNSKQLVEYLIESTAGGGKGRGRLEPAAPAAAGGRCASSA